MSHILDALRRQYLRILLGLAVTAFFLAQATGWLQFGFIRKMENLAYDARLVLTMPRTRDNRIVIVDIDEKSLKAEGRWPWGRDKMARLVNELFDHFHVSLLGFDVVFAEPDESSGLKILRKLADGRMKNVPGFRQEVDKLAPSLDHDRMFAEAIKGRPVILGYYFNERSEEGEISKSGELPPPTFPKGMFAGKRIDWVVAGGYGANLPQLQNAALGAGHFNPSVDDDGVVRRVPMIEKYDGAYYESLSLAMASAVLGTNRVTPVFEPVPWGSRNYSGLEWLRVGDRRIPVDGRVRALVPYRGRQGSFPYVSATDVLHGRVDPTMLNGKIALVGTTAPGLLDLRSTPVQNAYPGVEIHANLIAGILDQDIKQKPGYTVGADFVMLLFGGLLMSLWLPLLSPLWATAVSGILLSSYIAVNLAFWHFANLVLPVAGGTMMILTLYLLNMSYGYFVETRGKRQLTGLFGQYVPPTLVDEMAKDPEAYSLEAENRDMTVLFSDVRGFTTISEGLKPRELSQLMNEFLTPMTHVIHKHLGTIDKYMGDAVMAFWGAPLHDAEHARHALEAAVEMIRRLGELQTVFKDKGWPEIRVGIGINTGVMSVGNMGSEFRMAYTVLGDAVNFGSRLEGLTKGYGVSIIVSETTKAELPDYAFRDLDRVRVKGKDKPVAIFEPIGPKSSVDQATHDELKLYQQALKYYRDQNWDMAELQFLNLARMSPQRKLYQVYAERVAIFRESPPGQDWDGVFTFTTK